MKFLFFIVPTFIASTLLFSTFGTLGLCGMTDCLGSGRGTTTDLIIGVASIVLAFIPFVITSCIIYQKLRRKPLDKWVKMSGWAVCLTIGALGVFQVIVDPGDAHWAGIPMLVFSCFFALSILNFPNPEASPNWQAN
ncbi:hypothetical protein [Ruegeria arenilitoris]|uniref:hypothetical protein n=1 Tax=Ruegeria arenilitoris TaxID=1173585 RepID=UPI00147CD388|nr:hypothetical protein [Ruegeria arenilitoris]